MPGELAIETRGLSRKFGGVVAVDGLDLEVARGEIFGFLGPNGAGKTTTLRMLSTLIQPTSGRASVLGHDLLDDPMAIRRGLGVMTERPGLYERLSVEANLRLWAEAHEVGDPSRAVGEALDLVGLGDRLKSTVAALSKGLKQRAALARAIVHQPALLLLDEPSSGLDPAAAVQVEAMLRELVARGTSVFINTHRLAEAQRLCDRVAILSTRLIATGSPAELRQRFLGNTITVTLAEPLPAGAKPLLASAGVTSIVVTGLRVECRLGDVFADTPRVVEALVGCGARVLEVAGAGDLERVYLELVAEPQEKAPLEAAA